MKLKMYKSFLTKVYSLVTVFLLLGTNLMPVVSSLSDLAIAQESLNETTLTVDNPVVEITPEVVETPVVEETEEVVTPQVEVVEEKEEVSQTPVVDETEVVQEETQVQEVEVSIVDSGVGPLDTLVENVLYTCNELSAIPCVTTDKDDYSPIELVTLNGYSYKANTQYELTIYSNDLPPVTYTTVVLTDENGDFEYKYQLDGKYRPHYFVEVSEVNSNEIDPIKNIVAKTTFKDSPISGCTVDSGGPDDLNANQKDLNEMCVDYTNLPTSIGLVWNWDDTAWNGNNSGDGCALLDSDGDGLANFALCVTVKGDPASLNVFNLYACNDTSAKRCYGAVAQVHSAGTTCTATVEANANPFNNDSDTVARCTLAIADVSGAQLVDVCSYPSQSPNSSAEDCIIYRPSTGKLEIVKMLAPTNDSGRFNLLIGATTYATNVGHNGSTGEVVLTTGDYTVSEAGYGLTDLSKYSTSIVCKDLNGTGSIVASGNSTSLSVPVGLEKDIVCTVTNTVREGTLNVVKRVLGSDLDESNFSFDVYRWVNNAYVLVLEDVAFESDGTNSFSLEAGTYKVEENSNGDFTTGYSNCNDIVLPNGGSATCTITNTRDTGTLIVEKVVEGSDESPSIFSFSINGEDSRSFDADGSNSYTVDTGSYTVVEDSNSEYTTTYDNCSEVVVSKGETETCTITNTRNTGTLVVEKVVVGSNASPSIFSFSINGASSVSFEADGSNSNTVDTGTYSVVEDSNSEYTTAYDNCSEVVVSKGETETCTITNTRDTGTLVVEKVVVGSNVSPSIFSFSINGASSVSFEADGSNSNTVDTGTYSVVEDSNSEYTTTYDNCSEVVVSKGETETCTITNTRNTGTLVVEKVVVGSNASPSIFSFSINGASSVSFEADGSNSYTVNTGSYTVVEDSNSEYTTTYDNCSEVVVSKGETETCTITNTRNTGKLVVYKDADINATNEYERLTGQEASTLGFTFDVNGEEEDFNTDVVLPTGEYEVVENVASGYDYMGWYEVGSDYTCNQPNTDDVMVTITNEGTTEIVLCNQIQYSSLTVNKMVDYEGNNEYVSYVKSENTPDFKWGLTESTIEYEMGSSQNLPLNVNEETYSIYETDVEGYTFVGWYYTGSREYSCNNPESTDYPVLVELLSEDDNPNITLCNQAEIGKIVVNKGFDLYFDEVQGYVIDNEKAVELGFKWLLGENEEETQEVWGEAVAFDTGTYYIEEIFEGDYEYVGYFVGRGSCNQFLEDLRDEAAVEEQTYNEVIVERGETTYVTFCNKALQPTLDITKINDAASVKSSGENVEYTILVDVKDASVKDLVVTDLLPDEIKYQSGSFEVYVNDVPNNTVPEPTYNSPGTWDLSLLGTLSPDDQVKLVYSGVVQNNVDSGLYKDLAFSSATSTHDTTEYANAVGTWSDGSNFVGTEVEVANEEIEEAGVVLGTQTVELPRTGMNPVMIIISSILMLVGAMLVAFSYGVNLNRLKKFVMLPVFVAMMMFISPQEADASVAVRVQSIPSNINSDFTISYTTLNTTNNSVEVKCMVKKPSEVVFSQFGSTVNTINGGDAGNCVVDNGVLTAGEGIYEFKVSADGVMSDVVSTNYDITKPGTPINFEKSNSGACGYDISFKTAADGGETVKVEIFRSTQKSFTADSSTFAGSVAVGSDESKVVPQAKPVCDQTYYFAVRAVDNAGNTSEFVGDTIVVTEVVFVDAGNNPGNVPNQGGEVEGETDNNVDDGEIKGETDNGEDNNGSGSGNGNGTDDGDELGENDRDNNPINWGRVVGWFGGVLLGILVVWQLVKMGVFQTLLTKIMRR